MNAEEAEKKRFDGTVAIFYNPITQVDGREWDSIAEFKGPFHPLIGNYKCDDPDVLHRQLEWIRRAGVDLMVYDIYGFRKWSITDLPKDKTLPLLIEELSNQENESRKLKLVIWLEKWFSNPTAQQYQFGLDYIRDNLAGRDFYYRYKGYPLVLAYENGENTAYDAVAMANPFCTIKRIGPFTKDIWSYIENYPQTLSREWMSVNPGFDSYLEEAYCKKHVDQSPDLDMEEVFSHGPMAAARREDGRYFERQLLRAREGDPAIIFISGWNDWQCCLQIEPAVEYEFQYVDMAARLLGRESETAPYRRPMTV